MADLSRNCKGFRARESVHARVTESRAQGTGVGRDIRRSPSRVRSVFLLIYGVNSVMILVVLSTHAELASATARGRSYWETGEFKIF